MKEWWPRVVIVLLMVLVVGVPFLLRPAGETDAMPMGGDGNTGENVGGRLVILSPHNEQIRFELSRGFNRYRVDQGLVPITFDWRSSGGTTDLRKQIISEFESQARQAIDDGTPIGGIGYDLFFGGGEYDHNKVAKGVTQSDTYAGHPDADQIARWEGIGVAVELIEHDGKKTHTRSIAFPISVSPELDASLIALVFPSATIAGERLYHPEFRWVGTALSNFGIAYNRDVLSMLNLPEPTTWADLADGRYQGWLALADPGHSGSIAATYNAILRRLGWADGWSLLRRTFANARYFSAGATKVPTDVSAGEAAAGMCIDFYGRFQAQSVGNVGRVGENVGGGRMGYVDPVHMTATTADPISLLHGAPSRELAVEFISWMLSKRGQRLWQQRLDLPADQHGPARFELRRLPVRRDLYTAEEMADWADQVDPFTDIAAPFAPGMPDMFGPIATVAHAMAINQHEALRDAWAAIQRQPADSATRAAMVALFDAMPAELTLTWPDADMAAHWQTYINDKEHPRYQATTDHLTQFVNSVTGRWRDIDELTGTNRTALLGRDQRLADTLAWTAFFRENYRQIMALGQ